MKGEATQGLRLTYGRDPQGRMLAIISEGGHVQLPGSGPMTVLAVEVVKNAKEAKRWGREQMETRPWETRQ